MPTRDYDAVVVGARAAGAATALLLARAGLRVAVVDRTRYGADTLSTHALMRAGVIQLRRWGLLDGIVAAGTPPVRRATFHVGRESTTIGIKPSHGVDALYAPRRTVLDPVLVDAAVAAGAEVRYGTTVTALERDRDGRVTGVTGHDEHGGSVSIGASFTIGADGMSSRVAGEAGAATRRTGSAGGAFAYGYWSDLPTDGYEWFFRPGLTAGVIPTNGGQACVFAGTNRERFRREAAADAEIGYTRLLEEAAPEFVDRLRGARRPATIRRFPGRPGHVRQAGGAGWALVGDAGYFKDPISAHGITDALRDAELLARAIVAVLVHGEHEASALRTYESTRDRLSGELFAITDAIASYAWDASEVSTLLLRLNASMTDEVDALAALDATAPAASA